MKKISVKETQKFIKFVLKTKLSKDLHSLKIFKEGDVETCSYYHFRKFLKGDPNWTIIARKHINKKYYVDLMLYKNMKPVISIELKWNRRKITKKDKRSLIATIKNQRVSSAYYISVILNSNKEYVPIPKVKRLHEIPIKLSLTEEKKNQYNEKRKVFRRNLKKGRVKSI